MRRRLHLAVLAAATTLPAWAALPTAFAKRATEFMQFTDQSILEMQVLHSTKAMHLLGPYSRFHWNHPGPFFFYLLAPLYALSGHATRSIWLSVWLLNVACLVGIVCVVERSAGRLHAFVAGALLAWQVTCLGADALCDSWGPWVITLPFELLAFLCVAVATGRPQWLPLSALVASFVAQTEVATLPTAALLLAAGTASGLALSANSSRGRSAFPARAWLRGAMLALGVGCVVWLPSIAEQASTRPGNLAKLWEFLGTERRPHTLFEAYAAISEHFCTILRLDTLLRSSTSASALRNPAQATLVAMGGLLGLLPVALVSGQRRGDRYVVAGSVIAIAGAFGALLSATRAAGPLMSYLFLWTTGLGTLSVAMSVGELAARAMDGASRVHRDGRPLSDHLRAWSMPLGLVASAAAFSHSLSTFPSPPYFYGRPAADIMALAEPVEQYLQRERTEPVVRIVSEPVWGIVGGVLLKLYKDNVDFSVESAWLFMFGNEFAAPGKASTFLVFGDSSYDESARTVPGCFLIAEKSGVFAYASVNDEEEDPCP